MLVVQWALPKPGLPFRPEKLTNIAARMAGGAGVWRVKFKPPKSGEFRRSDRNVLQEGMRNGQAIDTAAGFGIDLAITLCYFDDGGTDGKHPPYHGKLDRWTANKIRRYMRGLLEECQAKGVRVRFAQFLNEGDHAPSERHRWADYLDDVVSGTRVFVDICREVYPGVEIVSGGQQLGAEFKGRKTVAKKFLEENLYAELGIIANQHGNGQEIGVVLAKLAWAKQRGLRFVVWEDRAPGPTSDLVFRWAAFTDFGAEAVGYFVQRNVNAEGDNPSCRWGSSGKVRDSGACWHCRKPPEGLPDETEWALFSEAAALAGWTGSPANDLPMDDSEPPVDPPTYPPEYHAFCAMVQRAKTIQGTEAMKADPNIQQLWENFVEGLTDA